MTGLDFRVDVLGSTSDNSVCNTGPLHGASLTFQHPLIKEYTLNYSRIPNMTYGIFLNQGILEGLGRASLTRCGSNFELKALSKCTALHPAALPILDPRVGFRV